MHAHTLAAAVLLALSFSSAHAQKASNSSTPSPDIVTFDQGKALSGGITAGDTAGFPITISAPGSYKLTGNLVVPANVSGILVTTSDVTIDLNGFSVTGPNVCGGSYPGISCANKGVIGIGSITSGNNARLTVRNGNVGGFGYCVDAQYQAVVSDLAIHDCYIGALAFEGSRVANVSVSNSEIGMYAYGSLVDMVLIRGANFGVRTTSSHISGLTAAFVGTGVVNQQGAVSALRTSMIQGNMPIGSGVVSMGGNLCNGGAC